MNAKKHTRQLTNPPPKSRSKIETDKEPETNPHKLGWSHQVVKKKPLGDTCFVITGSYFHKLSPDK